MDYDEAKTGPTKDDLLRDGIFRARLDLEQLRRSGNLQLLNSAQARLRLLMREQEMVDSKKIKRRPK
jgi:hypothetical protein